MRNKILFVLALVLVFSLGVLSVRAWDHYRVAERARAFAAQAERDGDLRRQQEAEAARQSAEAAEKQRLHDVCVSNATKAKTPVAACNIQQVQ